MASAITKRRQLAPTMGPNMAPAGATLRAGPFRASLGHLASGRNCMLVGLAPVGLVSDAAGFSDESLSRNLALDIAALAGEPAADEYPSWVLDCTDPPSSVGALATSEADGSYARVGVIVTASSASSGSARAEADAAATRAGTSDPLAATLLGLSTLIATKVNRATATAKLEAARRQLFEDASALGTERRRMNAAQREYVSVYGLTPAGPELSRRGAVRNRGRVVAEILGIRLPVYETPAANLRAAKVAYEDLATLVGEERAARERHIKDLIDTANAQQVGFIPGRAVSEVPRPEGEGAGAADRQPA